MSLGNRFFSAFRDRRVDKVCAHFQSLRISVSIAERGRNEALFREPKEQSVGVILLSGQVFQWINVTQGFTAAVRSGGQLYYRLCYGVRDPKLRFEGPAIKTRSIRKRSLGLVGPAIDVSWEESDSLDQFRSLNASQAIKEKLIQAKTDVEVVAYADGYWVLSNRESALLPARQLWDCYQAVAKHLLDSSVH